MSSSSAQCNAHGSPLRTRLVCSAVFLYSLILSACSSLPFGLDQWTLGQKGAVAEHALANDQVARNLVYTLVQLPGLHPQQTTLQVSSDQAKPFSQAVLRRIDDAGYAIQQHSEAVPSTHVLTTSVTEIAADVAEFTISVGGVSVKRVYTHNKQGARPTSAQTVSGAAASQVTLNDDLFSAQPSSIISAVSFSQSQDVKSTTSLKQRFDALRIDPPQSVVRANLHDTLISNYASLFDRYEDVYTKTVVFGNDSMVLGDAGKATVQEFVDRLDPDTDLISIIGCSHGQSTLDNGNELLAIGRSHRVKEAFMYAGLSHNLVLDEACWSPTPFDEVMPRRGVLITLKRRRLG